MLAESAIDCSQVEYMDVASKLSAHVPEVTAATRARDLDFAGAVAFERPVEGIGEGGPAVARLELYREATG